jgi:hypothetical protein
MSRYTYLGVALALLAGCAANPYAKFYQPAPDEVLRTVPQRRVQAPPAVPELLRGNSPQEDLDALYAEGYVLVGQSSFNGPKLSSDDAVEQGKKIGADRVIVYGALASTEHTEIPLTLPTTQTSVTNGMATAYGPAGSATAFGTATTTTYGTQTTYIPMTVRRYDALALYLVKEKYSFGARFRNLTAAESKTTGTVDGVALAVVVRGSPAAAAGFLPADVVTKVNGTSVIDSKQLSDLLSQRQGQTVTFTMIREGAQKDIPVTLASY